MSSLDSHFDVIVVGSGASGGWASKRLAEAGLKVALLDAGRPQSDNNFSEHKPAFELKYRDQAPSLIKKTRPRQSECYACTEYTYEWFANDLDEPYSYPKDKEFSWQGRVRMIGGRTNVWGRQSYRLSDLDFKAASHDGYGEDWPLSYKDVAPYYDIVERYVGVSGRREGLPQLPDGQFQPPMPFTCLENDMRERLAKLNRSLTIGRTANLTQAINGRAACHYCGPCERGCVVHAYFNSSFTTVADAVHSGNCTLIPNAMAYQVLMDRNGKRARGVSYIDRDTRALREVNARAVVLCAQAQESVRILLNSATRDYPNGLANSSGVLGHYLMDHVTGATAWGLMPGTKASVNVNGPNRPNGIYLVRYANLLGQPRSKKYLRGFGFQGGGGWGGFNWGAPGFGEDYKKALRQTGPQGFSLVGFGECLARWDNYVEIDKNRVDAWGIPVLKIHMSYGDNDLAIHQAMADEAAELLEACGLQHVEKHLRPSIPGNAIHEVGIARMGHDAKKSVLNQFQQSHDVANLFVMDGAGFTSTACQNPTLTIMALAVRSTDYLTGELKRGNI